MRLRKRKKNNSFTKVVSIVGARPRFRRSVLNIEYDLPRMIFEQSNERYFDVMTGYLIAIIKTELYGKLRDVMVVYVMEEDCANLLTVHPLKEGQKENRIKSGRWRKL
jgi:hypothetical protein